MAPGRMAPVTGHCHEIAKDQQRQDETRGLPGGKDIRKHGHEQDAKPGDAGFCHAHQKRAENDQRPLPGFKIHLCWTTICARPSGHDS